MTDAAAPVRPYARIEADFFRALNGCVEPAVRAGLGSPGLSPLGMIVLETTGKTTGLPRPVPLVAVVVEGCLFVSTVRGARSQWVANLTAHPRARYWVAGEPHDGLALVFRHGSVPDGIDALPAAARLVASSLLIPATEMGWTFAVIRPEMAG